MTLGLLACGALETFKLSCPAGSWICGSELEIKIWGKLAETTIEAVHMNKASQESSIVLGEQRAWVSNPRKPNI